jgi:hypothetical protein
MTSVVTVDVLCVSHFATVTTVAAGQERIDMEPTLEIVHFTVEPDAEEALLAGRAEMIAAVRAAHPGLLDARLVDLGDGRWMDLVRWRSADDAHAAAADFPNIAAAGAWASNIAEVSSMTHGRVRHEVA